MLAPTIVTITYYDTVGMNQSTVTRMEANYMLIWSGGDGIPSNGNDTNAVRPMISQITYNASNDTATLQLLQHPADPSYRVEVNGDGVR